MGYEERLAFYNNVAEQNGQKASKSSTPDNATAQAAAKKVASQASNKGRGNTSYARNEALATHQNLAAQNTLSYTDIANAAYWNSTKGRGHASTARNTYLTSTPAARALEAGLGKYGSTMEWYNNIKGERDKAKTALSLLNDEKKSRDTLNRAKATWAAENWSRDEAEEDDLDERISAAERALQMAEEEYGYAKAYNDYELDSAWEQNLLDNGISWGNAYGSTHQAQAGLQQQINNVYAELQSAQRENKNAGVFGAGMREEASAARVAELEAEYERLLEQQEMVDRRQKYALSKMSEDNQAVARGQLRADFLLEQDERTQQQGKAEFIENYTKGNTMGGVWDALRSDRSDFMPTNDWSQEQLMEYQTLLGYGYEDRAREYAAATNKSINDAKMEEATVPKYEWGYGADATGVGRALRTVAGTAATVATAPERLASYLNKVQDVYTTGVYTGEDRAQLHDYAEAIASGRAQAMNDRHGTIDGKGWGDVYQAINSVAQSMVYGNALGKAGTLAIFFGQAADSGFDEAIARGATGEQAALSGLLSGAAEVIAEKIPLDNLLATDKAAARGLAKSILKQSGLEGAEEGITSLMNTFADKLVMGDKSALDQQIKQLMAEGMSYEDARAKTMRDYANSVAWDVVIGAVSGAAGAGLQYGRDAVSAYDGRYGADAQTIVNEAKQIKDKSGTLRKAEAKVSKGKAISNATAKKLVTTVNRSRVVDAVEKQINARSPEIEQKTARSLSNAVVAKNRGEKLTANQQKLIEKNSELVSEIEKDMSDSKPADWVKAIGVRGAEAAVYGDRNVINARQQREETMLNSGEYAEAKAANIEQGQDVQEYSEDFDVVAEVFGNSNNYKSFDEVWNSIKADTILTEAQARTAWEVGKAKLAKTDMTPKLTRRGTGKLSFEAVSDGGVQYEAPSAEETETFKRSARYQYLKALAKKIGVDIVFFKGGAEGINGKYQGGTVYLAIDASPTKYDTVDGYVMLTAAHELTHYIREASPARYAELKDFVTKHLIEQGKLENGKTLTALIAAKRRAYADAGVELTVDAAVEEVIADACELMLKDNMLVAELRGESPGLHGMMSKWLKKFMAKVKAAFTGLDAYHAEAKGMMDSFDELQRIWNLGLTEAAQAEVTEQGESEGKYSFAGRKAETADDSLYQQALDMEKSGKDSEAIRRQTGWFKGMDGQWRYEIDDADMQFSRRGFFTNPDVLRFKELDDKFLYGTITNEELAEVQALSKALKGVRKSPKYLREYIKHDELFKAYPELRNVEVAFDNLEGERAHYNARANKIVVDNRLRTNDEQLKDTIVHELQHAIQNIEGFSTGASPAYWQNRIDNGYAEEQKNKAIARADKKYNELWDSAPAELKNKMREINREKLAKNWDRVDELEAEIYDSEFADMYAAIGDADFDRRTARETEYDANANELYFNTAGEVEARDTTTRRKLDAEQRKNTRPDIDREDVVFAEGTYARDMYGGKYSRKQPLTYNEGQNANGVFVHTELIDLEYSGSEFWTGRRIRAIFSMDDTEFSQFHQEIERLTKGLPYEGEEYVEPIPEVVIVQNGKGQAYQYEVELDAFMHGEILSKTEIGRRINVLSNYKGANQNGRQRYKTVGVRTGRGGAQLGGYSSPDDTVGSGRRLSGTGAMGSGTPASNSPGNPQGNAQDTAAQSGIIGKFSIKDEAQSDRMLLANTLYSAAQNDAERRRLNNYKAQIDVFEDIQQQLADAEAELSRAYRTGDKQAIAQAQRERNALTEKLIRADKKLLELQATKPLKELMARVKQDTRRHTQRLTYERRNKKDLRDKIKKLHSQMSTQLLKPKENKYVPTPLLKTVAELLDEINLDSGRSEKIKAKMTELSGQYQAIAKSNEYGYAFDNEVAGMIAQLQSVIAEKDDTSIYHMSKAELEMVYNTMEAINHTVRESVKLIGVEENRNIFELAKAMMKETGKLNPVRTKLGNKYISATMRPDVFFKRMGGYVKNSVWQFMGDMLNDAQRKQTQLQMEGAQMFEELMRDEKALKKMTDPKNLIDIGLEDANGNPVLVTMDIALKIYMDTMAEDNARHMMSGGYTVPNMKEYYKGKVSDAYSLGAITIHGFGPLLADLQHQMHKAETEQEQAEIQEKIDKAERDAADWLSRIRQNIYEQMGEYELAWVEAAEKFFNGFSQRVLNETTMMVYGFEKATVPYYVPIHTDKAYRQASFESISRDMSLENSGFMKSRVEGAKNPMLAEGIVDVINGQIDKVAKYAAMMPAIRNFQKVYGKSMAGFESSVQAEVRSKFRDDAIDYIENIITDLTSPRNSESKRDELFAKLRGSVARSALRLNVGSALEQMSSYPKAATVVGYGPLLKALKDIKSNPIKDAEVRAEIAQWTPLMWYRMKGYFDRDFSDLRKDNMMLGKVESKLNFALNWLETVEGATVGQMWYAAQYYVEDTTELERGTDEFMRETAKVFNRIVEQTQANYSMFQRPDILRDPSQMVKSLTMFMSERLQNANMVYDAVGTYNAYVKDFKNGENDVTEEDVKQAKLEVARTGSSLIASSVMSVMFKALGGVLTYNMLGFRDEDDELTPESVMEQLVINVFSSIAGTFLLGNELFSIVASLALKEPYYGISVGGVDLLENAVNSVLNAIKDIPDMIENGADGKIIWKACKALLQLFGIPANNTEKLVRAITYRAKDIQEGNGFWEFASEVKMTDERRAKLMYKAIINEDVEKLEKLVQHYKTEAEADAALAKHIKTMYQNDELSAEEAQAQLEDYASMSEYDAKLDISKLTFEKEHGFAYEEMKQQYLAGTIDGKDVVKFKTEYGDADEDDAAKEVNQWRMEKETGLAYNKISSYLASGDIDETTAAKYLKEYGGYEDMASAEKKVSEWLGEIETGIPYDKVEDYYAEKLIGRDELINYYMNYKWLFTEEHANEVADKRDFIGTDDRLKSISVAGVAAYNEYLADAGIDKQTGFAAWDALHNMKGYENASGKWISANKHRLEYIDTLDLQPWQKTLIALAYGDDVDESYIKKYAPWA